MTAVSFDDVVRAAERLRGRLTPTPVWRDAGLDGAAGAEVWCKAECTQATGAFKLRGATNAIAALDEDARRRGVVAFSSGNHAQAVARAAAEAGVEAIIVMPHDAPRIKVAATESAGGRLVRYDRYTEDRAAIAAAIAQRDGRMIIPPFDHPDVIAGQGTVGLELITEVADLDAIVVPVGGGGLLAGIALAAAGLGSDARLYGVEPEAGDDHRRSRRAGRRVTIDVPRTIADGQQVTAPGELTWPITAEAVTDFVTVTDDEIVAAMVSAHRHLGAVLEPSGASALAAVLSGAVDVADQRVGVILSGGNVDPDRFHALTGRRP